MCPSARYASTGTEITKESEYLYWDIKAQTHGTQTCKNVNNINTEHKS